MITIQHKDQEDVTANSGVDSGLDKGEEAKRSPGAGLGDRVAGGRIPWASPKRELKRARREKAKIEWERRHCKGLEKKAGDAPVGELTRENRAASREPPDHLGQQLPRLP